MCAAVHANAYGFLLRSLWLSHPSEVGFLIISLLNQCSQGENQKAQDRHQSLLEPKTQGTHLRTHPDMPCTASIIMPLHYMLNRSRSPIWPVHSRTGHCG